jgi:signal transduction histidine kinase
LPTGDSRSWHDAATIRRTHPQLPVVLFTGDVSAVAEARALRSYRSRAAGFAGVVGKPFAIEDLLSTLKAAVEGRPGSDLTGMIVHELRQPLTVVRGHVQLALKHLGDPDRGRLAMDQALTQVDRMEDLVDQLLDHAHVASENFSINVTRLDLVDVLAKAIASHEYAPTGRISFVRPPGAVALDGDPVRIAQILDNLLSNALKYSAVGSSIEVSLSSDGVDAEVRVSDHGVGIPDDELARLFTPFYRSSKAGGVRGTGLGLHISRKLAEHHGGRLWLDETSSAGSVFALALPVARGDGRSSSSNS